MAYVDEGPDNGYTVLLVHGEPTWGYLYRRMLPALTGAGLRTVVPDLIGFGRSDKPTAREAYTYAGHVAWLRSFVEQLDLRDIVLFVQDWGGLLGLRLAAEHRIDSTASSRPTPSCLTVRPPAKDSCNGRRRARRCRSSTPEAAAAGDARPDVERR